MSAISTTVSQTAGSELLIKCKSAFDNFFGDKIPSEKLGDCRVYMYCPQFYPTTNNYKEVDGFVYYTGDEYGLHIVPDTEYYHYFYGIAECKDKITQKNIGLMDEDGVTIEFTIPDSAQTIYEVPATDKKLDVTEIPHQYTETADIAFVSEVWNISESDEGHVNATTKKFSVKFERNENMGKITFEDIMAPAGSDTEYVSAIISTDFVTFITKFFGSMPIGLSCPLKSRTYVPNR